MVGVFVRSPRPDALRAWYAEHSVLELQEFGGAVITSSGGETLVWAVFAGGTDYFGSRDQQAMVNYRVRDLDAMLAQLRAAGVPVEEHIEEQGTAAPSITVKHELVQNGASHAPLVRPSGTPR